MGGSENGRARVLRVVIERPCVKKKNARKYDRWQGHSGGMDPHLRHLGRCPITVLGSKSLNKSADAYEKHGDVYMKSLDQLDRGPAR